MSIYASATDTILASPVVSVILTIIASGIAATTIGVFKILSRLSSMESAMTDLGKRLIQIEHDFDVIKWGAVAGANLLRPQVVIQPPEEQ